MKGRPRKIYAERVGIAQAEEVSDAACWLPLALHIAIRSQFRMLNYAPVIPPLPGALFVLDPYLPSCDRVRQAHAGAERASDDETDA